MNCARKLVGCLFSSNQCRRTWTWKWCGPRNSAAELWLLSPPTLGLRGVDRLKKKSMNHSILCAQTCVDCGYFWHSKPNLNTKSEKTCTFACLCSTLCSCAKVNYLNGLKSQSIFVQPETVNPVLRNWKHQFDLGEVRIFVQQLVDGCHTLKKTHDRNVVKINTQNSHGGHVSCLDPPKSPNRCEIGPWWQNALKTLAIHVDPTRTRRQMELLENRWFVCWSTGWDLSDSFWWTSLCFSLRAECSWNEMDFRNTWSLPVNLTVPATKRIWNCHRLSPSEPLLHWISEHGVLTRPEFSNSSMSATTISPCQISSAYNT